MTTCWSFGAGVGVDGVDTAAACLRVLMLDMFLIGDSSQMCLDTVACLRCFDRSGYLEGFDLYVDRLEVEDLRER